MIEWNDDVSAAPHDGFYVLINWLQNHYQKPHGYRVKGYGMLAGFYNGAWRCKPQGDPLPDPTHWRWRPQGDSL